MGLTVESLASGFPFWSPPLRAGPERTVEVNQAIEAYQARQRALNEVLKGEVLELYFSSGVIDALRDTVISGPLFVLHEIPGFQHKIFSEAAISFRQDGNSFCSARVTYDDKNGFRSPWQGPDFGRMSAAEVLEQFRKLDTSEGIQLLRCSGNFRFGFWKTMTQIDFWFGKVNSPGERELYLAEKDLHSKAVLIPEGEWGFQGGNTICDFVNDVAFPFFS